MMSDVCALTLKCLSSTDMCSSGVMNGSAARHHSESGGEAELLNSPVSPYDGKRRIKSAGSEMVSLQQFLNESTEPVEVMFVAKKRV